MDTATLEPRDYARLRTWRTLCENEAANNGEPQIGGWRWTATQLDALLFAHWLYQRGSIGG